MKPVDPSGEDKKTTLHLLQELAPTFLVTPFPHLLDVGGSNDEKDRGKTSSNILSVVFSNTASSLPNS